MPLTDQEVNQLKNFVGAVVDNESYLGWQYGTKTL